MKKRAPQITSYRKMLSDKELIGLYHRIETALPGEDSRIVQFVSCHFGEGATTVGRELASLATRVLDCPTLFIGAEAINRKSQPINPIVRASLLDVVAGHAQIPDMLAKITDETSSYDQAYLAPIEKADGIQSNLEKLKQVMGFLRNQFKLIIISTPGVLSDPAVLRLNRLADGAVFVMQAERTRAPAARQALKNIDATGTKVIGLVFNKRRYYIPNWLYRFS